MLSNMVSGSISDIQPSGWSWITCHIRSNWRVNARTGRRRMREPSSCHASNGCLVARFDVATNTSPALCAQSTACLAWPTNSFGPFSSPQGCSGGAVASATIGREAFFCALSAATSSTPVNDAKLDNLTRATSLRWLASTLSWYVSRPHKCPAVDISGQLRGPYSVAPDPKEHAIDSTSWAAHHCTMYCTVGRLPATPFLVSAKVAWMGAGPRVHGGYLPLDGRRHSLPFVPRQQP